MSQNAQMTEMINQWTQAGWDVGALLTMLQQEQTEPNKTPLGLNRWELHNKPTMQQFNDDNEVLDREIRALSENSTKPLARWRLNGKPLPQNRA